MHLITDEYTKLNKNLHSENKDYGTSGGLYIRDLRRVSQRYKTVDILDYGCGKGTLADNLPFTIHQYDPAIESRSEMPEPADIVVCTDVLEHIEPELLDNVLSHMASLTKKACYITACTREAKKTLSDGRNAHLIIKDLEWWKNKLGQYFSIEEIMQGNDQVIALLEPKKGEN